jgi:Ferritin-like
VDADPAATAELPPITDRTELALALNNAAELEHMFVCQYLYSAFSLKKDADAECSPAQLESVRRWASAIYMIARQEMEHLSLVLSMLTAIGKPPYLDRPNFPSQFAQFLGSALKRRNNLEPAHAEPCNLPYLFEPFGLGTARRYTCMESPRVDQAHEPERSAVLHWCFQDDQRHCGCVSDDDQRIAVHRPHMSPAQLAAGADLGLIIGDIERFYQQIRQGFVTLDAQKDPLFTGDPSQQVVILSEYNIFLFPVTNLSSALAAIDLITRQGEGLGGPPGFDSHFQNYYEIAVEYEQLLEKSKAKGRTFEPSLPLPRNPKREDIKNPLALALFDLFNESYATAVFMLTGLYGHFQPETGQKYPHLSAALQETVFAPVMTMMIRPIAEVLVSLPLETDLEKRAAPNFFLSDEDKALLANPKDPCFAQIGFYLERFEKINARLAAVATGRDATSAGETIRTRICYVSQNVYRITGNLRQIYQSGVYEKFRTTP